MKKIIHTAALTLTLCIGMAITAYADSAAAIMGTYTGESDVSVYAKGTDLKADEVSVQIATAEAASVKAQPIEELDMPMQTLVMLDNSLSITAKNQKKIEKFMQMLIADRLPNEQMSIATFDENAHTLIDYTSEREELLQAADGVSYQRQSTYLTDALYDVIMEEYVNKPADVYRRIVVISDGVDKKAIGYTKDELYDLIKKAGIPIYTIGCKNGTNNEELENMFALSRITNVDYYLLDKVKDLSKINDALKQDRAILKLTITPADAQMDGSVKAVRIAFQGHPDLTADLKMPQLLIEEPPTEALDSIADNESGKQSGSSLFILLIAGGIALIAVAVGLIVFLKKKGERQEPTSEPEADPSELQTACQSSSQSETLYDDLTEMLPNDGEEDNRTVMIWNHGMDAQRIVLTDVHAPEHSYQITLNRPKLVGRKADQCDIVFDYEPSVSGAHCELSERDGRFYVRDLKSANGTFLNGGKVTEETELSSGSVLRMGRLELRFDVK